MITASFCYWISYTHKNLEIPFRVAESAQLTPLHRITAEPLLPPPRTRISSRTGGSVAGVLRVVPGRDTGASISWSNVLRWQSKAIITIWCRSHQSLRAQSLLSYAQFFPYQTIALDVGQLERRHGAEPTADAAYREIRSICRSASSITITGCLSGKHSERRCRRLYRFCTLRFCALYVCTHSLVFSSLSPCRGDAYNM